MQTYFLFLFYLVAGTLLLHAILRRKHFPFRIYHTIALVCFKLFLGGLYGYIFLHKYNGDDTWRFFFESREQTDLLLHRPQAFFDELLPGYSLQLAGNKPVTAIFLYIEHFENWFMIKLLGVLNLFSGRNYYIDLMLFDFLTLAGPLLLYKMLYTRYPGKRGMYFLLLFFVPTITFWCSGIRAEAVLLFFSTWAVYQVIRCAENPSFKKLLLIIVAVTGVLLFRAAWVPVFSISLLALYLSLRRSDENPVWFRRLWIAGILLFFLSFLLPAAYRPAAALVQKQRDYFALTGNTRYALDSLDLHPLSFIRVFPQAVANSSFRPYPWEGKGLLQSLSAAESVLLITGIVYFFLSTRRRVRDPLLWFFLFYGVTQIIAAGYLIPFPGALVRYRSIPLLFLLFFLFYRNELVHDKLNFLFAE